MVGSGGRGAGRDGGDPTGDRFSSGGVARGELGGCRHLRTRHGPVMRTFTWPSVADDQPTRAARRIPSALPRSVRWSASIRARLEHGRDARCKPTGSSHRHADPSDAGSPRAQDCPTYYRSCHRSRDEQLHRTLEAALGVLPSLRDGHRWTDLHAASNGIHDCRASHSQRDPSGVQAVQRLLTCVSGCSGWGTDHAVVGRRDIRQLHMPAHRTAAHRSESYRVL